MKHLMSGVAIAAALAIAAPAWAQSPMSPSSSSAPKSAATTPAKSAEAAPKARHKRMASHRMARRAGPWSMTDQLNRAELARIQSGGSTPPGGAPGLGMRPGAESTMPAAVGAPKQP